MFSKGLFANMRRSGFGVGISKGKLTKAMVEILGQLPVGTPKLKDVVVYNLGLLGQMSATRDINAAWTAAKKKVAREHPERFVLVGRATLRWNDGSVEELDRKISTANFKKLNALAAAEGCSVDRVVTKLVRHYKKKA